MSNDKSKRKEIIEAAKNRFAHYGFSKVTMDEIANDIGMGKASLYYYFSTKEALFEKVVEQEMDLFISELEKVISKKCAASRKLKDYVTRRMKIIQKFINIGTLNVHSILDNKSIFKELFKNFQQREFKLLEKIFSEGRRSGEFNKHVTKETAKLFLNVLSGLRMKVLFQIKDSNINNRLLKELEKEMPLITEIFIKGIKA